MKRKIFIVIIIMTLILSVTTTIYAEDCQVCGNEVLYVAYDCANLFDSRETAYYGCWYSSQCSIEEIDRYKSRLTFYHSVVPYLPPCTRIMYTHIHDQYHVPHAYTNGCGIYGWEGGCVSYP